jgi:signal transduction histidine kinase
VSARKPSEGITIRAVLLLGFGLTFGLWIFAGYYFTERMAGVQREAAEINARYMHAQDLLSAVRAQVLLGSVSVRDALLDPNPGPSDRYRRELEDSHRSITSALQQYVPVIDSEGERAELDRLRTEIDDYHTTMLDVLATDSRLWRADARDLLQERIVPRREVVLRASENLQALDSAAFVQQQTAMADVYSATQRRTWEQLGFALAASFAIGLFAFRYSGRLEDRLRRQVAKNVKNTRDLQRLSSQLITAQEEERRSIARELHDEVGQVLTAIKVELSVAQRAIEANGGPAHLLEDARSITDGALHTVRDLSHLLHPPLLDDLGLPAAIDWYLRGFSRRHGVRADLTHDPMQERLTPETEAAVYRIIQEALTNVAKHARASACRVHLQRLEHSLLMTIEDDGVGFEPAAAARAADRGLGLISIRERVAHLQGTLRVESAPGKGTRLVVEMPAPVRAGAPSEPPDVASPTAVGQAAAEAVVDG